MLTDFEDPPFRPRGAEHLVCGAIPAGFDAPVYVSGAEQQGDESLRRLLLAYPEPPAGLRTVASLRKAGLRPRNLFRPDGYVLGPPKTVRIPGHEGGRGVEARTETVYPPAPVYDAGQAAAFATPPDSEQVEADRRAAADWAQQVLADPDTVILAVHAIGSLARATEPLARAEPYELGLSSATGGTLWHQFVDPGWGPESIRRLDLHGATPEEIEGAPAFGMVDDELLRRLSGKRVVTYGRNVQYAALYTACEYVWVGDGLPEGTLWRQTADTLAVLGRSRWECAQLRHAEFEGEWDASTGHYSLPPALPGGDALHHCRATAAVLRAMAAPAPRDDQFNGAGLG